MIRPARTIARLVNTKALPALLRAPLAVMKAPPLGQKRRGPSSGEKASANPSWKSQFSSAFCFALAAAG